MLYSGVMDDALATLEGFLDTIEHGEKPDDLSDVDGLARWARTIGDRFARASATDLARARDLRAALRDLLRDPADRRKRGRLADALRPFTLRAGDPTLGEPSIVADGAGVHAALGAAAASFAVVRATGSLNRVKLCVNCGWAFVDQSRNRSRRWCEMASCGNQSKVRTYRNRRRARPASSADRP